MNSHVFALTLRRRLRAAALSGFGLAAVAILSCSLFPAIGDSIGNLDLGSGVSDLIGGGNFATLAGYLNAEIFSIYGPLVVVGGAIVGVVAVTAREEEDGILELILAAPISRAQLMLSKGAAVGVTVALVTVVTWIGLLIGVALAGGGVGAGSLAAELVHLVALALFFGALAFALAVGTGRRNLSLAIAGTVAFASYLLNGLAPISSATDWAQKLSPFYYYNGSDPLSNGVDLAHVLLLLALGVALVLAGTEGLRRRDLNS